MTKNRLGLENVPYMGFGIFITATDTGVGKTFIAKGISEALRKQGYKVAVYKPLATGAVLRAGRLISEDVRLLSAANTYTFKAPLAPSVAARLENKNISVEKILSCYKQLCRENDFVIVEGIGGLLVPIKKGYLVSDLIKDLDIPAVIVSRPGLGTINHTLLTVKHAEMCGIKILGIVFNEAEKIRRGVCERTNPKAIKAECNIPILGWLKHGVSNKMVFRKIAKSIFKTPNSKLRTPNYEFLDKRYVWHPFTQMKDWQNEKLLIIERARGSWLKSTDGKRYLDGVSSLWVNVHGHRKKELDEALISQIAKVSHSTVLGLGNVPSIELARLLTEITPNGLNKVFYSDNGSTAVEVGLKIAFQYWQQKGRTQKTRFVSFVNAYHGDTIGSVSVGGIDLFHKKYKPLLFKSFKVTYPYCYRCPIGRKYPQCKLACTDGLKRILSKHSSKIAAVVIEPLVQGAAGMLISPPGFLKIVRQLCAKYNCLMIVDEVATGFGRTGKMFACEHEAVSPDIMAVAKSITGGYLPLAATLTTDEIYNAFCGDYSEQKTFFHGHTYTGNPLAAAAAIANLRLFKKEKTLEKLQPKIDFLKRELQRFKGLEHVGDIRQKGFMIGIELVADKKKKQPYDSREKTGIKVIMKAREKGVILRPLGNTIVLMPPLAISKPELKTLLDATYASIREVTTA